MNRTLTEQKVLKKLGIPDFRHMTKNKIVEFAAMAPKMDPDVAKAAIAQFPRFKELSTALMEQFRGTMDSILQDERADQEPFCNACKSVLDYLKCELDKENLTSEDKNNIINAMIVVIAMMKENNDQHRKFLSDIVSKTWNYITLVTVAAVALLGVNVIAKYQSEGNDEESNGEDAYGNIDVA
jgi:hypothetical protein